MEAVTIRVKSKALGYNAIELYSGTLRYNMKETHETFELFCNLSIIICPSNSLSIYVSGDLPISLIGLY